MDKKEAFPDMESGFRRYKALFCDALARLARQGFVVQPGDADDLIQDFFADAWRGLEARYEPSAGAPANYLYGAFVRFARQRILRSQRWEARLRDLAFLADQVAAEALSPLDALVRHEEANRLREALAELPPGLRTVLLDYFASGAGSQRKLADKYNLPRTRVREHLLNGFGGLVMRLAARADWPLPDREVALALWCEGWGLEEAATRLGRSAPDVRAARDRLMKLLANALAHKRETNQPARPPAKDPAPSAPRR